MSLSPTAPLTAQTLNIEISDLIATIELNRPEKRNAISPMMAGELADVLAMLMAWRFSGRLVCTLVY